jgi:hypothetical protein
MFAGIWRHIGLALVGAVAVVAVGASGCGDDGVGLVGPISRDGNVTILISRGTTPVFDWESEATVHGISVYNYGATGKPDQIMWGYANISATPPISYGATITGGVSLTGQSSAPPLQSGVRYMVEVVRPSESSHAVWIVP